jgi:hypothetical protein
VLAVFKGVGGGNGGGREKVSQRKAKEAHTKCEESSEKRRQKREGGSPHLRPGQSVKECGFPDVGKAHETHRHHSGGASPPGKRTPRLRHDVGRAIVVSTLRIMTWKRRIFVLVDV